jgi:hypothetical protein
MQKNIQKSVEEDKDLREEKDNSATLKREAASYSETLKPFYKITWHHILEDLIFSATKSQV